MPEKKKFGAVQGSACTDASVFRSGLPTNICGVRRPDNMGSGDLEIGPPFLSNVVQGWRAGDLNRWILTPSRALYMRTKKGCLSKHGKNVV